jgi:DNA repair photolyase
MPQDSSTYKNGRGAQVNPHNKFLSHQYTTEDSYLEYLRLNGEDVSQKRKTKIIDVYPKTIVNKVVSPDVGMNWSLNPYQGCEHGCAYCYARNSHEYWGYSAGSEFEENILVKRNAPEMLEKFLYKKSWKPETIVLSGNTDCYQPIERELEITRELLKVFLKFKHPVGIITKNALIQRDLDLIEQLAAQNLIAVNLSITTLNEDLRRKLEPRTASAKKRVETVKALADIGVPVNVMMAPIIPGLNSHEVLNLAGTVAEAGATSIAYTMVRLNGQIADIFKDWCQHHYPDRADKILHQIEDTHGGSLNDSNFGRRMHGDGKVAENVSAMMKLARKRFFSGRKIKPLTTSLFERPPRDGQMMLF